jgi:hypothetical protein
MQLNPEIEQVIEVYKVALTKYVRMKAERNADWAAYTTLLAMANDLQEQLLDPNTRVTLDEWRAAMAAVKKAEEVTMSYREGMEPVRNEMNNLRRRVFDLFDRLHMDGELLSSVES